LIAPRGPREALKAAGFDNPGLEARLLEAHARGDADLLAALLARRLAHEPMAFILGRQGFWTLDLEVSPATLIPRADSETLIEAALAAFPDRGAVRTVLDLGTGTGCLLLAALAEFPQAWGLGVDIVPAAAALAAHNAARAGLADRAAWLCADWTAPIREKKKFDLILANPPYVESAAIAGLMAEVAGHEPASALDGGPDGLEAYRRLIPALSGLLAPGGVAILEIGLGQGPAAADLARRAGLSTLAPRADLAGIGRALVLSNRLP
jgi:release factor glutamine methyltransferase